MRGLFDRFMKACNARVQRAIRRIEGMDLGVENLSARIEGRFITLRGVAPSREVATRVMELFKQYVGFDNILNAIRVSRSTAPENGA